MHAFKREKKNLLFRVKKSHQRMAVTMVVAWLLIVQQFITTSVAANFPKFI